MSELTARGFEDALRHFSAETLGSESSSIYALWPDLTFAYFNEGWLKFARENDGPDEDASRAYLGRSFFDVVPAGMKPFYEDFFHSARQKSEQDRVPPRLQYDCNSPDRYRQMSMTAYPIPQSEGILVVNSLVREAPLDSRYEVHRPEHRNEYLDDDGLIHQCAHCRRVMHPAETGRWDMVPELIERMDLRISHTLCLFCRDIFWNV